MIPYDELVGALANWRAKQGLPVVPTPPTPLTGGHEAGYEAPAIVPSGPRTAPPMAAPQPSRISRPVEIAPDHTVDEDVEDAALLEEAHYEPESDDFEMAFGRATASAPPTGEATTVGAPPGPSVGTGDVTLDEGDTSDLPPPPRPTKKKRAW